MAGDRDDTALGSEEAYQLIRELDPGIPVLCSLGHRWHTAFLPRLWYTPTGLLPSYYEDGSTGKPRHCSSDWASAPALAASRFMPLVASWPASNRMDFLECILLWELRSQSSKRPTCVKGFNSMPLRVTVAFSSLISPGCYGISLQQLQDYVLQIRTRDYKWKQSRNAILSSRFQAPR